MFVYVFYKLLDSKGETESVFATDMPPSFYSWYKITLLHMWLLFVRFRLFKKGGNEFSQALLDRFWEDMEFRQKGIGVCLREERERRARVCKCVFERSVYCV